MAFRTVPDELLAVADAAVSAFRGRGYRVRSECSELGFPNTPTLLCTRHQTRIVVEIMPSVQQQRLDDWVAYAKSSARDFRIIVCLPNQPLPDEHYRWMRACGVGCWVKDNGNFDERLVALDQALNLTLPRLDQLPQKARILLGPCYEQFDRGQWREGFEDACKALEEESRRYLKRHVRTGRIKLVGKQKLVVPTNRRIDGMTMGQMAKAFESIAAQNRSDSVICECLSLLNRDRVGVVHKLRQQRTEQRLRKNVGPHMWRIFMAIKEVVT